MARWVRRRDRDSDAIPGEIEERHDPARRAWDDIPDDGGEVLLFRSRDDEAGTDEARDVQERDDPDDEEGTGTRVVQVPPDSGPGGGAVLYGEIVDEDESRVPVNPPDDPSRYVVPWQRDTERRAVVPVWLRDKSEAKTAARWVAGYAGHHVAFHAVRVPKYAGTLAGRAPRGLGRTIGATARWVTDTEAAPLRQDAVRNADAGEYMRLARLRSDRVRLRMTVFAVAATLLGIVGLAVLFAGPGWLHWLVGAGLVLVLGVIGAPADRPLTGRAVVTHEVPKLTDDMVVRALGSLGIAEINRSIAKGPGISFPAPITRDGPGFRADIDLPFGVTVSDIIERRDRVASGLRRPLGCVWPEPAHDAHAGRLVLWVGDRDMSQAKPAAWPLAKRGTADIFRPVPFGTDQRGRPVTVELIFNNGLIGAMPRQGKTFALRVLLLSAVLDPRVQLALFELKGTGDLDALAPCAHRFASGADDEAVAAALAALREMDAERERRAKVIRGLPKDLCPENKVTPGLAERRSLGLHPVLLAIDECQELFTHPAYGAEAAELCTRLIKLGPALGIILLLATQRPDSKSLPTGVSANAGLRFCLRVMGQVENDMVLGTSAYRNGTRATTFTNRDKGIGYLVGASDDPQIVRTYYIDAPTAEAIARRARALREAAGTLTGHAIGDDPDTDNARAASVLTDVAAVLADGEDKVWSETIVTRLAALRPDTYEGWTPQQLTAALAPYGVRPVQVWAKDETTGVGANRRGITRTDLHRAVTKHNAARRKATGRPVDTTRQRDLVADSNHSDDPADDSDDPRSGDIA